MTIITDCYTCGCNVARKGDVDDVPDKCSTHGASWETATVFAVIEFVPSPDFQPTPCGVLTASDDDDN